MRILFVHQSFPTQFIHLAPELLRRGHDVRALTASTNQATSPVPMFRYTADGRAFPRDQFGLATHYAEQTHTGELAAAAALKMRRDGFMPDVIFGHGGWGETLFLGEIWPGARRITYAEFFYHPQGLDVGFDPELQHGGLRRSIWVRARQGAQLLALNDAHIGVSPTEFQASTYPDYLRPKIRVLHDGIDTDRLAPNADAVFALPGVDRPFRAGEEVLTYVSRNLEPYRGYHIFMRALPRILRERPEARVVIVGGDGQSYGLPPAGGTWKERFLAEAGDGLDLSRVHFAGQIPYRQFQALMQVSRVHAYLTYPFVLSWSMLEAMSAGALVVGSRTPPIEEVLRDGENGRLVDFFDIEGWSGTLIGALADPARDDPLRRAGRETIRSRYDLRTQALPRQIAMIEGGG